MNRVALSMMMACIFLAACTVHPEGEARERELATAAGTAWQKPFAERTLPQLGPQSHLADYLAHAEQGSGLLEAAWNRWIAALEQVPQDGTQPTTAMLGIDHTLDGGKALDRTALSLMSDAMNNLMLPGRLTARAEAALARARTAAAEFDQVRLALQRTVAEAYYNLAWHDEDYLLMLRVRNVLSGLETSVAESVAAGTAGPAMRVLLQIAIDRLDAERERMHADRPGLVAAVRRAIGAGPDLADVLAELPDLAPIRTTEQQFVEAALERNPDIAVRRREHDSALAEQRARQWLKMPEFSLRSAVMGDGVATLGGALSLPFLRGQAIDGAIAQADAEARAAEALRRQSGHDAVAAVLSSMAELRGHEIEAQVLQERLLPHLRELLQILQTEWATGTGDVQRIADAEMDALEVERSMLRIRREHAITRARLAEATGALLSDVR